MANIRVRLSDTSPLIQAKENFVIIRCASEQEAVKTAAQFRGANTAAVTEQKDAPTAQTELAAKAV